MTDRLYYTDAYLRSFDATVRSVDRRDGWTFVVLDRTAFYPTSGGQPFDTGVLNGAPIVDVTDENGGSVAHVIAPEAADAVAALVPGAPVRGQIDWTRRFDHMQQHTGQHVLSAAFDRGFGVRTLSFHLGADLSTIDLAREMTPDDIAAAEREANRVVWEDRPVAIRFASSEEAAALPLRKEPRRDGTLRLIDVEGWDLSACGGTHVARTGAIGIIAVASWERFKGGQRLAFVCGGRALDRFRTMRDALDASVRLLSVLPAELPGSIERLMTESREQKRAVTALQHDLARYRASELVALAEPGRSGRLVVRALDGDAGVLKGLAAAITAEPGFVVGLVSTTTPALLVVARSAGMDVSAQQLVASAVAAFGGRGGGRPELAQAGGLNGAPDAIVAHLRTLLSG
jgi:alanyl-tRNA synthetase